jgi:3-oxoacyl-[acyl-carrier-protein] synthase III
MASESVVNVSQVKPQVGVQIIGSGSAVPTKIMTNEDLSQLVDTSDEWIFSRTGIQARRIASQSNHENLAQLAAEAGKKAIAAARMICLVVRHRCKKYWQPIEQWLLI